MPDLVQQIIDLHDALERANLPHAFGGALALAWCTDRARGTIDIDLNIFVPAENFDAVITALPTDIHATKRDIKLLQRDGQVRLWWETTPVDLFLNTTEFHEELAARVRVEAFAGANIPFLSCYDLAVFKAFFNRTKDWADLEAMLAAGTLNTQQVRATIVEYLGEDDERVAHLASLPSVH